MKHSNNFLVSTTRKLAYILMAFVLSSNMVNAQTVVDIIVNSEDHTTLEAAVIAAELDDDLSGTGPFTVFAPTNAAFSALPDGALTDLLENPTGNLAAILLHQVVSGKAMSGDLDDDQMVTTLKGQEVTVSIDGSTAKRI